MRRPLSLKRLVVSIGLILLLAGQAGAATVVDTLYPDADGHYTAWITKTLFADEYEEIDDPELTCGSESEDTYLHINGLGSVSSWRITNPPDTMGKDLQSVKVEWEMAHETDGSTTGDAKVAIGWIYNDGGDWIACPGGEPGYDTVTLTDECVVYSVTWTVQPCPGAEVYFQWFMLGFYDEDYYQPFIWSISVRSNCGIFYCQNRCFNVRIIATSETTGGQVIIIGARDEEDFHNPRRGIPPAAWE